MSVEILIENKNMTCGEGPFWDEKTNSLFYVDAFNGDIHQWNYLNKTDVTYHADSSKSDNTVSFIIPRKDNPNELIIGNHRKLAFYNTKSFDYTLITEINKKGKNNRLNDAKCDRQGRLWLGTMGPELSPDNWELGMGCLYSFDSINKSLRPHLENIDLSNGMAWTSDDRVMFYADSVPRKVYAFDYDISDGSISKQRTLLDFSNLPIYEYGLPDGMCIDVNDKIWLACYFSSKIFQLDPETGKTLREISFPVRRITSCCFGGQQLDELFVTSATTRQTADEKIRFPYDGAVFRVSNLGVKGTSSIPFSG